jgi:hypothetical protein
MMESKARAEVLRLIAFLVIRQWRSQVVLLPIAAVDDMWAIIKTAILASIIHCASQKSNSNLSPLKKHVSVLANSHITSHV